MIFQYWVLVAWAFCVGFLIGGIVTAQIWRSRYRRLASHYREFQKMWRDEMIDRVE